MRLTPFLVIGFVAAALSGASTAGAAGPGRSHSYVIAIGYNGLPVTSSTQLDPLHFADDDAIAFSSFASEGAEQTHLLTLVDVDTQRRLGHWVPEVKAPSLVELRAAVGAVRAAIRVDRREGAESTVYFYYSGHGMDEAGRAPSLALLDGELTQEVLYDDVLAALPATHVHLFVDACHAEAVVRPRDAQAAVVPTTAQDAQAYALATTLARFPAVGAIVAATRGAQTHEWETYSGGVFTHELLSGLRGAADVDGNRRVEYSEIAAFLSAANGAVADPRARLEPIVRAPSAEPRVAIVDLASRAQDAVLQGRADGYGLLSVEDEQGNRIVDVRGEPGYRAYLLVPASRTLYVRSTRGEAVVRADPGAKIAVGSLVFGRAPLVARGAVESALHRGLFATSFGRSYYLGFLDRATDLVPVPLVDEVSADGPDERTPGSGPALATAMRTYGWVAAGTAGAMAVAATAFGVMALDAKSTADHTPYQREANDAADRFATDSAAFGIFAGCAVVTAVIGTYLLVRSYHDAPAAGAVSGRFEPARLAFDF